VPPLAGYVNIVWDSAIEKLAKRRSRDL